MPRRLKALTNEKGPLEIYAITEGADGRWEEGWEEIQATLLGRLISRVPRSAFNHLLNGDSQPFIAILGMPPVGALLKLPSTACAKQRGCALYQKRTCFVGSPKLPWCYEPAGFDAMTSSARKMASDLIFLWKEQVYVIAVYDDSNS